MCHDIVDDLRKDMIAKSSSSRTEVAHHEHAVNDNNCMEVVLSRSTISIDDCVCRRVEEGSGALYYNSIDEDDTVCTYLQLDQSSVGNCNEEINDDLQLWNEKHDLSVCCSG
jgi:hypothetical protein